jgi:hypothetical protein
MIPMSQQPLHFKKNDTCRGSRFDI